MIAESKMPVNVERDAGFCSGSSENGDYFPRDDPQSPTDASEDSIEVKLRPIIIPKNKRKSLEPSKLVSENDFPFKKRIRFEEKYGKSAAANEHNPSSSNTTTIETQITCTEIEKPIVIKTEPVEQNPFRPWASVSESDLTLPQVNSINPAEVFLRHPGVTTLHRASNAFYQEPSPSSVQDEPLALLKKNLLQSESSIIVDHQHNSIQPFPSSSSYHNHQMDRQHTKSETSLLNERTSSSNSLPMIMNTNSSDSFGSGNKQNHRNYKNMTRERRIEANARERTRVHTISAAFDTLRKSIPSYSQSQKLSKLSVLRVACSYILTLSRIAGDDYSLDQSEPSINECTDEVSRTIQTEGKIRKKKDE